MRFLADENFPGHVVTALQDAGYAVDHIGRRMAGSSDDQVVAFIKRHDLVLLTSAAPESQIKLTAAVFARQVTFQAWTA